MTVTFVDGSTGAECDGSGFAVDASSNLATAIEMLAYAANAESDEDADFVEALELCLDPDCIGTEHVKRENGEKESNKFLCFYSVSGGAGAQSVTNLFKLCNRMLKNPLFISANKI